MKNGKANATGIDMLVHYRTMVSSLMYYIALINLIADRVERGELTNPEFLQEALYYAEYYQNQFLEARRQIGLPCDESALTVFRESFAFLGFSLREGRFYGDPGQIEDVCGRSCTFAGNFPTREEALKYEVATLAYMNAIGAKKLFVKFQQEAWEADDLQEGVKKKKRIGAGLWKRLRGIFEKAESEDGEDGEI